MSEVQLYCGDCLELLPTLEGVDAVVTDPPYGRGAGSTDWRSATRIRRGTKFTDSFSWDDKRPSRALEWISEQGTWVVWGGNYFCDILGPCVAPLMWHKKQEWSGAEFELAWTKSIKGAADTFWLSRVAAYTVMNKEHPHQKPLPLMRWCIEKASEPGDTILDLFMGSGTTGVACVQTGRHFVGVEIDPHDFKIAQKRIAEAQLQMRLPLGVTT